MQKSILKNLKGKDKPVEVFMKAHGEFKRNELDGVLELEDFKVFRAICSFGAMVSGDEPRKLALQ